MVEGVKRTVAVVCRVEVIYPVYYSTYAEAISLHADTDREILRVSMMGDSSKADPRGA